MINVMTGDIQIHQCMFTRCREQFSIQMSMWAHSWGRGQESYLCILRLRDGACYMSWLFPWSKWNVQQSQSHMWGVTSSFIKTRLWLKYHKQTRFPLSVWKRNRPWFACRHRWSGGAVYAGHRERVGGAVHRAVWRKYSIILYIIGTAQA